MGWADHIKVFEWVTNLVRESHFEVSFWQCLSCRQRFVYVWTEFIDWSGGDDAQYHTLAPIDDQEAETIAGMGANLNLEYIGSLGRDRRHLGYDLPTGKSRRLEWRGGIFPVMAGY